MSRMLQPEMLKSQSINSIHVKNSKSSHDDKLYIPSYVNLDQFAEKGQGIVSDQGDLGVKGIDVPISGILGGRVGCKYFYK